MLDLLINIFGIILLVLFLTKVVDPIFGETLRKAFDFKLFKPSKRDKLLIKWFEKRSNFFTYGFATLYIVILIIEYMAENA